MSEGTDTRYDPHAVEARRQASWAEREAFRTPSPTEDRPHLYIKPSAPFTSGNVHIGHVRSYSIGDAYARFRRARGDDVLFAFGFDAFGLPAERVGAALRHAHEGPASAPRLLAGLGALVPELRRGHVPVVPVAVPDSLRG